MFLILDCPSFLTLYCGDATSIVSPRANLSGVSLCESVPLWLPYSHTVTEGKRWRHNMAASIELTKITRTLQFVDGGNNYTQWELYVLQHQTFFFPFQLALQ